jgi:uncharacterized membrane protein YphA (DoxX/SURF4 family)
MGQNIKNNFSKDTDYAALILRVSLGSFFVIAGLAQLVHLAGFVDTVKGFAIVNGAGIGLAQTLFPWIELVLGLMLIFGLATSLVSAITALLSFVFAAVNGFTSGASVSKEVLFIAVALALMLLGAGRISLDGKMKGGK